jgi:hypothetical protein
MGDVLFATINLEIPEMLTSIIVTQLEKSVRFYAQVVTAG